jgi:DNA-directed RNA polymerase subunit RPC12/RpoP
MCNQCGADRAPGCTECIVCGETEGVLVDFVPLGGYECVSCKALWLSSRSLGLLRKGCPTCRGKVRVRVRSPLVRLTDSGHAPGSGAA